MTNADESTYFAGSDDESTQGPNCSPSLGRNPLPAGALAIPADAPDVTATTTLVPLDSGATSTINTTRPSPLFFADSDDEDVKMNVSPIVPPTVSVPKGQIIHVDEDDLGYVDIPQVSSPSRPSSSIASNRSSPSAGNLLRSPSLEAIEPPKKKVRLAEGSIKIATVDAVCTMTSPPVTSTFKSAYLGSFIVGNAWSTVKGKGYCRSGDDIVISRDNADEATSVGKGSTKGQTLKASGSKGKASTKKQLTLATLMKQPPKLKKKIDTSVRILNKRGFGT